MPTELSMHVRYRRSDRQVYRQIAGEHLLIDLHSKSATPFFALTPTAVLLWQALAEWQTEDQLASRLVAEYRIAPDRATADVHDFLEQLDEIAALTRDEVEA